MSLDELKARIKETPINHIIGSYIPVDKKGTGFVAQCPFHDDRDPSLQINPSKNMFMCFVDNIGGDAINFVMRFKSLDFIDALKDICRVMSWNFDDYVQTKAKSPREEMAKKILTKVTSLYQKSASAAAAQAFQDFVKKRDLSPEIVNEYSLGFAPGNNAVTHYLESIKDGKDREFALKMAKEIGLIREDKYNEGSHYDTFRDRIVFPIWDHFGHVHGFTTRATRDDQKAKYMNSPESFVFKKNDILYGLHLAKNAIKSRDEVILCEGNMDQIALYKNGFENTVAVMGIALGESSLQRVLTFTKNVVLALDSDAAGFKASERINAQLLKEGVVARFIDFSPHKDPDDFLQAEGKLAFAKKLEEARAFIDHALADLIPKPLPETVEGKLQVMEKGFDLLSPLGESLAATERIMGLARSLGIKSDSSQILKNYSSFLETLKKRAVKYTPTRPQTADVPEENTQPHESNADKVVKPLARAQVIGRMEKRLLQVLVQHPECLTHDKVSGLLDLVENDEVKRYVSRLQSLVYEIDEKEFFTFATNLLNSEDYSLELKELAGAELFKYQPTTNLNEVVINKTLTDLRKKLEEDQLKTKRDELRRLQKECTTNEEEQKILAQITELQKKINDLKN